MSFQSDEDRWRQALKETGLQEVMRQLRCYPGRPEDVLSNLPLLPPYPSRAFCQQWCLDEEGREVRPFFTMIITFALLAVLLLSYASCTIAAYTHSPASPVAGAHRL
jgi:hypothetical protein